MTTYLDWNATTQVDPRVAKLVMTYMIDEFGNAGSRTHEYGQRAKQAVEKARRQIADFAQTDPANVVFTSGATESNNLAILGLEPHLREVGRMHIVTSLAEHKAVLEPIQLLESRGFEVTWLKPDSNGVHDPELVFSAIREDTGLVSLMRANNETGVLTDIAEIVAGLDERVLLHVDCAQSFGKESCEAIKGVDLVSVSGHKLYAPKGIGALLLSDRVRRKKLLTPLMVGGGQERGLRPGTLPVQLIVGLGLAVELARDELEERTSACVKYKQYILEWASKLGGEVVSGNAHSLPNVVNLRFVGLDSEFLILKWKDQMAISNGSACTSQSYSSSHVLKAMGLTDEEADECLRLSWSHAGAGVDKRDPNLKLIVDFSLP